MDTLHSFDDERIDYEPDPDAGIGAAELSIGGDERRMHVRAYNHWVSLLRGRAYPSIEDLDPASIADFGAHSVLLDFSQGVENPAIQYLGRTLREECGLDASITHINDVPSRSLLSRLTDHYLQIIANRSPIGFEAEFVGTRGHTTLYRGILMPFSSDEDTIDFIYGVINWKEVADPALQAGLDAELSAARAAGVDEAPDAAVWADGPGVGRDAPLADQLTLARESAAAARAADGRSRAALYRALGRAHDFRLAAAEDQPGYQALLADAGIAVQPRAPMTPVVKLVFGADYDKTRLTEFAAVLGHAEAEDIAAGTLADWLDAQPGGIKAVVKAVRDARRPAPRVAKRAPALAERPSLAELVLPFEGQAGEPVLLVARAGEGGALSIVGTVADAKLVARAVALLS